MIWMPEAGRDYPSDRDPMTWYPGDTWPPRPPRRLFGIPITRWSIMAVILSVFSVTWSLTWSAADPGAYNIPNFGVTLRYPTDWTTEGEGGEFEPVWVYSPGREIIAGAFFDPVPAGKPFEQAAKAARDKYASTFASPSLAREGPSTLPQGVRAWRTEFYATEPEYGDPVLVMLETFEHSGKLVSIWAYGWSHYVERDKGIINDIFSKVRLWQPKPFGVPRDQGLFLVGKEHNNPRDYDPATSSGTYYPVFSGLVTFNKQLQVVPDLAESWDISADGTQYTFHLRKNARFHNGRSVTAEDVIYSWERVADPKTDSHTVLTYLGDITGIREKRAGEVNQISGLKAIDEQTLQVKIDEPKPYFLMKLAHRTAMIVDRANVESVSDWYRRPNGTGAFKLGSWNSDGQVFKRNEDFYLGPSALPYVVVDFNASSGIRKYEPGSIDITKVSDWDVPRVTDPQEPLHNDLRAQAGMCTRYVTFDVTKPPFDDPKVRQAFTLATDRQQFINSVQYGVGLQAHGLYPPALPGYDRNLKGWQYDPVLARQKLAASSYAGSQKLPAITLTSGGFGSDISAGEGALVEMWHANLGVSVQVENLEPDKYDDEVHSGHHGQLLMASWCADYPDPENFADVLFHSGAEQNTGHYSNDALDKLLEQARIERDVNRRMQAYQLAEKMIVADTPSIFLSHSLNFTLVKPYIQGFELTPIQVPIERYLSIDPATNR